jgi:tetratricopeptide (TPR) repeat protein
MPAWILILKTKPNGLQLKVGKTGKELAREGDIEGAIAAYKEAQQLDSSLKAWQWNILCWSGNLYRQAVMFACEKAVELEPENEDFRRSRGLARALTGNTPGAIEDFQFFVEWSSSKDNKQEVQGWIDVLQKGDNPFTEEWLEQMRR